MSSFKIRQIEAFQAVMTTGSVTRAAASLNVSQPAVSQLIADFERHCGFSLFERKGSKIVPTREAEALFVEVQRMFVGVGQIARVATSIRDKSWGALTIAAFPAIARRVVPEIVWKFCEARAGTRFRIEGMRSRGLIDAVAAQHVDIGISILPGDRPEVESIHLHRLRGLCILPLSHRLADRHTIRAADLADENFISLGPQDRSRFMIDRIFEDLGVSRRMRLEVGQSETAFSLVAANAGVAIVDPISAYNNRDMNIAVRSFEPAVEFDMWLIRPKMARPHTLVEAFLDFLISELAEIIEKICAERNYSHENNL